MLATIMAVSKTSAGTNDPFFFRDVVTTEDCPEYNGYNTRERRRQCHDTQPMTKAVYFPLIDLTPSDPATMMTAMRKSQAHTRQCGQK